MLIMVMYYVCRHRIRKFPLHRIIIHRISQSSRLGFRLNCNLSAICSTFIMLGLNFPKSVLIQLFLIHLHFQIVGNGKEADNSKNHLNMFSFLYKIFSFIPNNIYIICIILWSVSIKNKIVFIALGDMLWRIPKQLVSLQITAEVVIFPHIDLPQELQYVFLHFWHLTTDLLLQNVELYLCLSLLGLGIGEF